MDVDKFTRENVDYSINMANKIISGLGYNVCKNSATFERVFPFTNEDIKWYFSEFDFKDKDVLSVLGSSDQVFDMFLRGAKTIHTFDIHPLTANNFYFKKAMIKTLSKNEFLRIIEAIYEDNIGDKHTTILLNRAFDALDEYNKKLYYTLFKKYGIANLCKMLYRYCSLNIKTLYLTNNNYELLQKNIDEVKIEFLNCDFKDLYKQLKQKYDIMYFSNIADYLLELYDTNSFELIMYRYEETLKNLKKYLNNDGVMLLNYLYCADNDILNIFNKAILDLENTKLIYSNSCKSCTNHGGIIYKRGNLNVK